MHQACRASTRNMLAIIFYSMFELARILKFTTSKITITTMIATSSNLISDLASTQPWTCFFNCSPEEKKVSRYPKQSI